MTHARLGLLLAAATIVGLSAVAQGQDHGDWHGRGGDASRPVGPGRGEGPRNNQNGGRFEGRGERQAPAAAPQQAAAPAPVPQAQPDRGAGRAEMRSGWNRGDGQGRWNRPEGQGRGGFDRPAAQAQAPVPPQAQRPQRFDGNRGFAGQDNRRSDNRDQQRFDGRRGDDRRFDNGRFNDRNFADRRNDNRGAWQRNWRNDNRYNWQDWRTRNRGLFHAPRYYPPRGFSFGYRLFSPGFRLDPFFYDQGYWIDDPWAYRLPPAYGPYRWIRYYNDALLVDITDGEVVDVIHNFFW